MERVTLDYAREHLDELMERARQGEELEITDPQHGTVVLRAAKAEQAVSPAVQPRSGLWKGRVPPPPDDFFDPLSEEDLALWYGDGR